MGRMTRREKLRKRVIQWFWFTPDRMTDKQLAEIPEWGFEVFHWIQMKAAKLLCALVGSHEMNCDCGNLKHAYCLWCDKWMGES